MKYMSEVIRKFRKQIDRGSMLGKMGLGCVCEIYLPGNVPSSKNSRRVVRGGNGRVIVIGSKQLVDYKKGSVEHWLNGKAEFLRASKGLDKCPLLVEFTFIRGSRHKFDYINPAQTVQDLMTEYGWIEDDNCDVMVPYFGDYIFDKEYSGVIIRLFDGRGVGLKNTTDKIDYEQFKKESLFCKEAGFGKRESVKSSGEVLDQAGGSRMPQGSPGSENDGRQGIEAGKTSPAGRVSREQDFYVGC